VGLGAAVSCMMMKVAWKLMPWAAVRIPVCALAGCASEAYEPLALAALLPSVAFATVEIEAFEECGDLGRRLGFED